MIACDLRAISAAGRPRYDDLVRLLRAAVSDSVGLEDGYSLGLDMGKISLPEVAEWMAMERLCCPFLAFNLELKGDGETRLVLRGPAGAKAILGEAYLDK